MKPKLKSLMENLVIVVAPVFLIVCLITCNVVPEEELQRWDLAISIGAMLTVIIFMLRNKKK